MSGYSVFAVTIVLPVVMMLQLAAYMIIRRFLAGVTSKVSAGTQYGRAAVSLVLFSYSNAVGVVFKYMHCVDVRDSSVVFLDPRIDCKSDGYKTFRTVLVALCVFPVVALPLLVGALLVVAKRRRWMENERFRRAFGVLSDTFRPEAYYWQSVALLRRLAVLVVYTLLWAEPISQAQTLIMLLVVCVLLQALVRPFATSTQNALEIVSLVMLIIVAALKCIHISQNPNGVSRSFWVDVFMTFFIVATFFVLASPSAVAWAKTVVKLARKGKRKFDESRVSRISMKNLGLGGHRSRASEEEDDALRDEGYALMEG
jgi:hypothetical protein